jgi:predicted esterase
MILVPATIHGRVLIEPDEGAAVSSRALVGFHGYGENADDMMAELRRIPGASDWTRVSIQALNRFYTRGDSKVVASWMTREDRDQAIADNIAYVDTVLDRSEVAGLRPRQLARLEGHALRTENAPMEPPGFGRGGVTLVYIGFSQGVAMAYRAALLGARPAAGIIALAGDLPPELKTDSAHRHPWPKVLIGVGKTEQWYSPEKVNEDLAFLARRGVEHSIVRFDGGHEWTEEFRAVAGAFLAAL